MLDEPTNDLDAETLDLLEDALLAYPGTVMVVSHDRDFLDETVTGLLVFDGRGAVREVVGGWSEWDRIRPKTSDDVVRPSRPQKRSDASPAARSASQRDRREVEKIEKRIATLEDEQRELHASMEIPTFWTGPADRIDATKARLAAVEREIEAAYEKWSALQA